jgi:hypothetical protein
VALVQSDERASVTVGMPIAATGWPDGTNLKVTIRNEAIDYRTGARSLHSETERSLKLVGRCVRLFFSRPAKENRALAQTGRPVCADIFLPPMLWRALRPFSWRRIGRRSQRNASAAIS